MDEGITPPSPYIRWTIVSLTTLGSFMVAVDSTIVIIGLPIIGQQLHSGVSLLGWVITAYILATAALLLQFGKLGDKYGKKKVYLIGFAIFGASSAVCGISSGIYEMISFRLIQGIGAAMISATTYPLIFASFPEKERGTAIGVNSVAWALGAIIGPVAGGFLVALDWRLIFFINVPVATIAVLVGTKRIPRSLDRGLPGIGRINMISSILLAFTVTMTLLWLTVFESIFAVIGLLGLVALLVSERKSKSPLIERGLRNKGFWFSSLSLAITNLGVLGIPFVLTFYYQVVEGFSPIATGLSIVPLSIAQVISNPLSGKLFDKIRVSGVLSLVGTGINGGFTLALSAIVIARSNAFYMDIVLVMIGAGSGLIWTPLVGSALRFAKPELRGIANGTFFTLLNLGFAASIAMIIAISANFLPRTIVSRIYLGNISGLVPQEAVLLNHGMAQSLVILSIIDFIAVIPIVLSILEQRKSSRFAQSVI